MAVQNLGSAVFTITANSQPFRVALRGVHDQLLDFVPRALFLGAKIGDSVIGAAGKAIIARKAETALGGHRSNVAYWQGQMSEARKKLADAQFLGDKQDVEAARRGLAYVRGELGTAKEAAKAAETAFAGTAASINVMAAAASAVVGIIAALAAGFIILTKYSANFGQAAHDVEQVFGSFSETIENGANQQAQAFGQNKSEYLAYAAEVGRSLQMLGVDSETAARQTIGLLNAVQRLAQSRGIGFGEALQVTTASGALFTKEQVVAYAVEKGILRNRNQLLNEGAEAILRNELAIERINATTEEANGAGSNWNSQVSQLVGNLTNLATIVGQDLEPAFVQFLTKINNLLKAAIEQWEKYKDVVLALAGPLGLLIGNGEGGGRPPENLNQIDQRNQEAIAKAGKRQAVGEAFGGGGGGHGAGFQGGLVEFSRRVQGAAFSPRLIANQEKQLAVAKQIVENTKPDAVAAAIKAAWKEASAKSKGADAPWF